MSLVIKQSKGKSDVLYTTFPILRTPSAGSGRVGRTAVLRGLGSVGHAVVAHDVCDAEAVIGEHARAPARLSLAVAREVAPAAHRVFIAPKRQRQDLVLVRKAREALQDRKSTRLNSSHPSISYAVFCLK